MPPPTLYPIKKLIAITPETAQAIEDYRFENRLKTEAEAIRQLIAAGLGKAAAVSSESGSGSARKLRSTGKSAGPARKAPERKSAPSSKLDQIRALREQDAG